jgi:nucleotide-binding universal stress UspA family protein
MIDLGQESTRYIALLCWLTSELKEAKMFEKIVVGVDGSPESEHAFRLTCDIAKKYGSEVHLVHTPQPKTVAFAMGAVASYHTVTTMPSSDDVKMACDKIVDSANAVAKEYGIEISKTHLERGDPAGHIIACAEECGADLIVTGRRGVGNVGSLILVSTSQSVNHLAKCACLSIV